MIEPLFTICVPLFSGLFTVTLKLTLPLAPGFWSPRLHTSGFVPVQLFAQATKVVLAGIASTIVRSGAVSSPVTLQFRV